MGQMLNRTPVYIHNDNYLKQIESEMSTTFPNYFKKIYFLVKIFFYLKLILNNFRKKILQILRNIN